MTLTRAAQGRRGRDHSPRASGSGCKAVAPPDAWAKPQWREGREAHGLGRRARANRPIAKPVGRGQSPILRRDLQPLSAQCHRGRDALSRPLCQIHARKILRLDALPESLVADPDRDRIAASCCTASSRSFTDDLSRAGLPADAPMANLIEIGARLFRAYEDDAGGASAFWWPRFLLDRAGHFIRWEERRRARTRPRRRRARYTGCEFPLLDGSAIPA